MAAFALGKATPSGAPLPLSRIRVGDTGSDVHPGCGATWSSTGSEGACQVTFGIHVENETLFPFGFPMCHWHKQHKCEGACLAACEMRVKVKHTQGAAGPESQHSMPLTPVT